MKRFILFIIMFSTISMIGFTEGHDTLSVDLLPSIMDLNSINNNFYTPDTINYGQSLMDYWFLHSSSFWGCFSSDCVFISITNAIIASSEPWGVFPLHLTERFSPIQFTGTSFLLNHDSFIKSEPESEFHLKGYGYNKYSPYYGIGAIVVYSEPNKQKLVFKKDY
jgi:hypothetical protein